MGVTNENECLEDMQTEAGSNKDLTVPQVFCSLSFRREEEDMSPQ